MALPLHVSSEPIARDLGYQQYFAFHRQFLSLCSRVEYDIGTLTFKKESTRERWFSSIDRIRDVFNPGNYNKRTIDVFNIYFSDETHSSLDDISERIQTEGITQASFDELQVAFSAARNVLDRYRKADRFPKAVDAILRHHLSILEDCLKKYSDFGEQHFWNIYKEMFSTFVQVAPIIVPHDEKEKNALHEALNAMRSRLTHALRLVGVAADIKELSGFSPTDLLG